MSPVPGAARFEQLAQVIADRVVTLLVEAIDVDALVSRVDVDALVSRVDVDALVSRVDVDALVSRVDVDALVSRVDVGKIVDQIDIDSIMEQTELGRIIARSTTGVASEALDLVRAQGVGLDDFLSRWVNRALRRRPETLPLGPVLLVRAAVPPPDLPNPDRSRTDPVQTRAAVRGDDQTFSHHSSSGRT